MVATQLAHPPQEPAESVPPVALYGGLFLISVGTLLLELLHTRLLSFMLYSSLVYIVVTFAMVGFGLSGVALAIFPPSRVKKPARYLAVLSIAFATTAIGGIVLLGRFPLSPYAVRSDPSQFLLLIIYYTIFILPYFFSGLCIASIFARQAAQISRLYFVNLIGSAVGCLLLVLVISAIGGESTLLLVGVFGLAAAMTFAGGRHRRLLGSCALLSGALIVAMLLGANASSSSR